MVVDRVLGGGQIPLALVTGGNSGLGRETARGLLGLGYEVVIASRRVERSESVVAELRAERPRARVRAMTLDLADLESVQRFSEDLGSRYEQLDLLINNAGVMGLPRGRTAQGFELHMGINHLGHFALSARLWPMLARSSSARIVSISSQSHRWGRIRLDTLGADLERSHPPGGGYQWARAYGASKLANLVFARELDRRLRRAGHPAISVAAHPGYTQTDIGGAGARASGSRLKEGFFALGNRVLAQSAAAGAAISLHAATHDAVVGGDFFGPDGWLEMRGRPCRVRAASRAKEAGLGRGLWERSQEATGVRFSLSEPVVSSAATPG